MKELSQLDLSENEIGDQGVTVLLNALNKHRLVEDLNLSGNSIGKSSSASDCGDAFKGYLTQNRHLEVLRLNWNNIRGQIGAKIV